MNRNRCLTPPSMPAVVMPRIPMGDGVPAIEAGTKKVHWDMYVSTTVSDKTLAPPARKPA